MISRSAIASGLAVVVVVAVAAEAFSGGRAARAPLPRSPAPYASADPVACAADVAATVGHIGRHVYDNDHSGLNAVYSLHRITGSTALGDAITRGDRAGARRLLRRLLYHQVTRAAVYRGSTLFAAVGNAPAVAPVQGLIRDSQGRAAGRLVFSVQDDNGISTLTASAGSLVFVREGDRQTAGPGPGPPSIPERGTVDYAGTTYAVYSFTGVAFTGGPVRISYLESPQAAASVCGRSSQQTILNTIAAVGLGIYRGEVSGANTVRTGRVIANTRELVSAARASDPVAVRNAIVHLFRTRLHVVRVRVTTPSGRLIYDLGGPAVLAPSSGVLRSNGRVVGRFLFSLQDDAGYLKLVHEFTGADVLMRSGRRQVGATLQPGPADPPDYGPVSYRGVSYQCFSFAATAFPDRPLRISLLVRPELYG